MEDYKYKLSIIIPMYNAEKYIANCLDSILNSDLPKDEYEVVIINDGSTDRGPSIAQEYVKSNEHFTYLTQDNQGQSVARNYGIKKSSGEYIWFVDADDMIAKHANLFHYLCENEILDVLAFILNCHSEDGAFVAKQCIQRDIQSNIVMTGRDAMINGYFPCSVCALWIRKKTLVDNSIFFLEGITQQDVELSYRLMSHANNVYFSNDTPYIYILHDDSTRRSTDIKKRMKYECDKVTIIDSQYKLSEEFYQSDRQLSDMIKSRAEKSIFGCVYNMFKHKEWKRNGINKAVLEQLKRHHYYPLKIKQMSWKKRVVSLILNHECFLLR